MTLLDRYLPDGYAITGHALVREGVFVGVVNPASQILSTDDSVSIIGPGGCYRASESDKLGTLAGLIATRAVLPGSAESVAATVGLIEGELTSRTASYVCSVSHTCSDVTHAFSLWRRSTVCLLGCGGIGSIASLLLAGAGVGRLILVDPDTVALSNLNRQLLFTRHDVGKVKVDVLRDAILNRFPDAHVEAYQEMVTANSVKRFVMNCDAILCTADHPIGLVSAIGPVANAAQRLFVSAGYLFSSGFVSNKVETMNTLFVCSALQKQAVMPSFGPTNAEVAGIAANLILLTLAGVVDSRESRTWETNIWPRT